MNPQNQKQNPEKPDYSFIMNQPGHEVSQKKLSKKLIAIVGLVGLLVIVIILGAITASNRNVQQQAAQTAATTVNKNDATAVIRDFLAKTEQGDYDAAYSRVDAQDTNPFTKDVFINEAVPLLKTLDLKSCVLAQEVKTDSTSELVFGCSAKDSDKIFNLEFLVVNTGQGVKIVYYGLGQVA